MAARHAPPDPWTGRHIADIEDTEALTHELQDGLAALGLGSADVRVPVVDAIPRPSEAGKLRTFVPLTSPS